MFAILLGWASQEPPETDECLTGAAAVLAVPFAWLALRALIRAARSLGAGGGESPAATSGVLRPRVFVDAAFCAELDQPSLEATYAHERAHARHRDPLRLWLAQLVTDLQWPGRAASLRLQAWRVALELARDEEARLTGVTGEDLAAAIVAALRHHQAQPLGSAVSLVSPEDILRVRIGRLLEPVPPRGRRSFALPVVLTGVVLSCVAWGHWFGDTFLRALPFISSQ
jgi:beta-lactamase regulating signal transducer with metallopeptidase domain